MAGETWNKAKALEVLRRELNQGQSVDKKDSSQEEFIRKRNFVDAFSEALLQLKDEVSQAELQLRLKAFAVQSSEQSRTEDSDTPQEESALAKAIQFVRYESMEDGLDAGPETIIEYNLNLPLAVEGVEENGTELKRTMRFIFRWGEESGSGSGSLGWRWCKDNRPEGGEAGEDEEELISLVEVGNIPNTENARALRDLLKIRSMGATELLCFLVTICGEGGGLCSDELEGFGEGGGMNFDDDDDDGGEDDDEEEEEEEEETDGNVEGEDDEDDEEEEDEDDGGDDGEEELGDEDSEDEDEGEEGVEGDEGEEDMSDEEDDAEGEEDEEDEDEEDEDDDDDDEEEASERNVKRQRTD